MQRPSFNTNNRYVSLETFLFACLLYWFLLLNMVVLCKRKASLLDFPFYYVKGKSCFVRSRRPAGRIDGPRCFDYSCFDHRGFDHSVALAIGVWAQRGFDHRGLVLIIKGLTTCSFKNSYNNRSTMWTSTKIMYTSQTLLPISISMYCARIIWHLPTDVISVVAMIFSWGWGFKILALYINCLYIETIYISITQKIVIKVHRNRKKNIGKCWT